MTQAKKMAQQRLTHTVMLQMAYGKHTFGQNTAARCVSKALYVHPPVGQCEAMLASRPFAEVQSPLPPGSPAGFAFCPGYKQVAPAQVITV